ncbi:hypothetical protein H5410_064324 [Solanum commersonii]|uniref:Uncharacterized protein n=1 Tax=Solanum commersonii TaxID=4109 RepID=A0A9J5VZM6_SOLCO|nr:hypothetical protein H5410_064324 [Solanum commersonii]
MVKSKIYPVNEVLEVEELATIMGGDIGSLPTKYLGLPLGAKFKEVRTWSEVIERMEKGWQLGKCSNMKIRRSFLWKRNYEGHKFHLVNWENVIMLKQQADKESKIQGSKTRVC